MPQNPELFQLGDTLPVMPDSLLPKADVPVHPWLLPEAPSNAGPLLAPLEVQPDPLLTAQPLGSPFGGWLTALLLGVFILLAWLNVTYRKRIGQLANAFVSNRFVQQMIREEGLLTSRGALGLNTMALTVSSVFVFQVVAVVGNGSVFVSDWALFLGVLGGLLVWALLKVAAISISGLLFKVEEQMQEYIFNIALFNQVLGLLLLPLVLCIAYMPTTYAPVFVWIGAGLAGLTFAVRVLKAGFHGFSAPGFSRVYIILYLCTLEILPLLLIAKGILLSQAPLR